MSSETNFGPYKMNTIHIFKVILQHSKRDTYPEGNGTTPYLTESGLFVQALDYRGVEDLPDNTFFSSSDSPNCSSIPDEYCRFPYYTAIHELFPPSKSRWIPLPNRPPIPNPSNVFLREKYTLSDTELRLSFVIIGGSDKMSLHLTPLHGFKLKKWSFTDIDIEKFGARNTYFVFLTYGFEHPGHRTFWLVLEQKNGSLKYGIDSPSVEISLATHYAHGPNQASDTVSQLRSLIRAKRLVPHESVGAWKWAIAPIIGVSEIVVRIF
ncbi:hypothetical protein AB6A40_007327 [Gnathostoma spinigerum]|uniref:Endoplasmic reticulum metallopeptidase 1-like C-terminal domain-containing protein n=1 Tax=Gnathostoma spinigerum TaxID=75299 RepID=A0ABD6EKW4_9BILA